MTKILTNKLLVSERFSSIQGEGKTTGVPAYFIRLALCSLSCGSSPKQITDLRKGRIQESPGGFRGDLHDQNLASWTCDTIPVWIKGENQSFQSIIDSWKEEGIYDDICSGLIHIIWTGGEPTIPGHQESIVNFNEFLSEHNGYYDWENDPYSLPEPIWYQEIETNGTMYIEDALFKILDQINCSPKLSNSGMSRSQRIIPKAIERIMEHPNYQFKFVISTEDDIAEMFIDYIDPFNIPLKKVCCMPGLDAQKDFFERTRWVMEMAKKYKFIGLTRNHIAAWNRTTGV